MNMEGNCLCGQVSYQTSVAPKMMINCHCTDCQKLSGSAYLPNMAFAESDVTIKGSVSYYDSKADSGNTMSHGFCGHCGSQMFGKNASNPGTLMVRAGTLKNTNDFKPSADIFVSSCAPWDHIP